jgi:hypothetical protein
MSGRLPLFVFDDNLATPRFPRPRIKYAVLIRVYPGTVTSIRTPWTSEDEPQKFDGDFYAFIDPDGSTNYGSAAEEWELMHTKLPIQRMIAELPAIGYVKTSIAHGYRTDRPYRVITEVGKMRGRKRESHVEVGADTLIISQVNGEVHHVSPEDEGEVYYSPQEAAALGLDRMSPHEFADWAVAQAMDALRNMAVRSNWPEEWPR